MYFPDKNKELHFKGSFIGAIIGGVAGVVTNLVNGDPDFLWWWCLVPIFAYGLMREVRTIIEMGNPKLHDSMMDMVANIMGITIAIPFIIIAYWVLVWGI